MLNEIDKAIEIQEEAIEDNSDKRWEFRPMQYLAMAYGEQEDENNMAIYYFEKGYQLLVDCDAMMYYEKGIYLYHYAQYLHQTRKSALVLEFGRGRSEVLEAEVQGTSSSVY